MSFVSAIRAGVSAVIAELGQKTEKMAVEHVPVVVMKQDEMAVSKAAKAAASVIDVAPAKPVVEAIAKVPTLDEKIQAIANKALKEGADMSTFSSYRVKREALDEIVKMGGPDRVARYALDVTKNMTTPLNMNKITTAALKDLKAPTDKAFAERVYADYHRVGGTFTDFYNDLGNFGRQAPPSYVQDLFAHAKYALEVLPANAPKEVQDVAAQSLKTISEDMAKRGGFNNKPMMEFYRKLLDF